MPDNITEIQGLPVNTEGEVLARLGTGSRTIAGVLPRGYTPVNAAGEMVLNVASNPTHALYVDKYAPDGGNGSISSPFNTIMAAVNVMVAGTAIIVAPGIYSENIVWRDLDSTALVGTSEINTVITNATPGHTFSWVPSATAGALVKKFAMSGLEIINDDTTGAYKTIHVDANAVTYPNTFCSEEFDIQIVDCEGVQTAGNATVYLRNVGKAYWTHGQVSGGDLTVLNPSEFITRQLEVGTLVAPMNFNVGFDGNNAYNGLGRSNVTIAQQSVVYGNLVLSGHPILQMDRSSLIVGNVTGTLTSFYASGRDYCPALFLLGQFGLTGGSGGNITLTFPNPQASGSAFNFVDLSGASIIGNLSLTKAALTPANSRGYAVVSGNAEFHTGTIVTSGYIMLDMTGAKYDRSLLTVDTTAIVTQTSQEYTQVTASRAATTADNGGVLKCNHATVAIVITINADALTGFSKSEKLELVQYGAASASFAAGAGVTLRGTAPTPAQYYTAKIRRIGANEWVYC